MHISKFSLCVITASSVICIILYIYFQPTWQYIVCSHPNTIESERNENVAENFYPLPENSYHNLYQMSDGAVQQRNVIENVQFFLYDVTKPVSEKVKKNKCVLLKGSNPQYNLCLETKGGFHDLFQNDLAVWEPDIQKFIKKFFDSNPDTMFLDLGMNIGIQSLYAASINPNIQVLGVEPILECVMVLHKSVHLNNFQNRFTVGALHSYCTYHFTAHEYSKAL